MSAVRRSLRLRALAIAAVGLAASPGGAAKPELLLQLGHTEAVTDADLYRVGAEQRAVSVGKDRQIKIWDAQHGSLLQTFEWPLDRDPERILVARGGRKAVAWPRFGKPIALDLQTGKHEAIDFDARQTPNVVCRSNDRRRVAIQVGQTPVRLYSLPDLTPGDAAPADTGRVIRCRFGTRDRLLAVADGGGFVSWFDLRKGLQPVDRRKIDSLMIDDLDEAPGGGLWAIKGRKDMVLWDLPGRRELARFRPGGSLGFVRFTRDGKHLVRGGHGGRGLEYLDPATGERQFQVDDDLEVPKGRLDTFRWMEWARRDGPWAIVRRRDDSNVEVWQGDKGQRAAALWGHPRYITAVAFFEDGRHLAIGTRFGGIERWDILAGARRVLEWEAHRGEVAAIAFSPDGAWAATGDDKGDVWVRERKTGRVDRRIRAGGEVRSLSFREDGATLVISTSTKTELFNVLNGFEQPLPEAARGGRGVAFAPRGDRLAVVRGDRPQVVAGERVVELRGRPETVGFTFSPDGAHLLAWLKDGGARRFDAGSGAPAGELKGPVLRSVAFAPGGRLIAGVGADAAVRFWSADDAAARAALLIDAQGEWIAWSPDGAFDASQHGGRYVAWKVGDRLYPVDRFREKFQIPGLLGEVLHGKRKRFGGADMDRFEPPPEVRIITPEPNATVQDDLSSVTVEVADAGGGVGEIRLYHQGRLVENVREGLGRGKHERRSFDVLLEPGRNRLVATALSRGRVESRSAPVDVHYGKRKSEIRLRMLAIGINDYRDDSLDLKYAAADAQSLADTLQEGGKALFRGGIERRVLLDGAATREGVLEGLDWLVQETRAEDVAVLYMAGHGETVGDEYFFVPQDLAFTGLDSLTRGGVSQSELQERIRRIPARKLVVLLDTCKSGAVSLGFATRGMAEKKALSVLGQAAGVYLVAASTSRQVALEDQKLGHGLFTWSLLRGLEGQADYDGDRAVSVRELVTFLETEVARVSREKFSAEQFPVTHGTGRNFPLAVVPR